MLNYRVLFPRPSSTGRHLKMPWEGGCKLQKNLQKVPAFRMHLLTACFGKFIADKLHSIIPNQSYH